MSLSDLPKDLLLELSLDVDPETMNSLCQIDKKINRTLCENPSFWEKKVNKDFGPQAINAKKKYNNDNNWKKYYLDLVNYKKKYVDFRAFVKACSNGLNDVAMYFYEKKKISKLGDERHDEQGFIEALKNGNEKLVNYLIDAGIDTRDDGTFFEAAVVGGNERLISKFFKANRLGNGLRGAATAGNINLIISYLNKGADVLYGIYGSARGGHLRNLDSLHLRYAETHREMHATDKYEEMGELIKNEKMFDRFKQEWEKLSSIPTFNEKDRPTFINHFIHTVSQTGNLKIMKYLFELAHKYNVRVSYMSPIMEATEHGNLEVLKFLIEKKGGMKGELNSLYLGIEYGGYKEIIKFFIEKFEELYGPEELKGFLESSPMFLKYLEN